MIGIEIYLSNGHVVIVSETIYFEASHLWWEEGPAIKHLNYEDINYIMSFSL